MSGDALAEALIALLPDAVVTQQRAYDWHSATFSGKRIVLNLRTNASAEAVSEFAHILSDHEFSIPDMLVADIAMMAHHGDVLTVEALLLEEDMGTAIDRKSAIPCPECPECPES